MYQVFRIVRGEGRFLCDGGCPHGRTANAVTGPAEPGDAIREAALDVGER